MRTAINTKVPCFNCSNRSMTCHSTCEQYLLYKREREEFNATVSKKRNIEKEYREFAIRSLMVHQRARKGVVGQR